MVMYIINEHIYTKLTFCMLRNMHEKMKNIQFSIVYAFAIPSKYFVIVVFLQSLLCKCIF